MLLHSLYTERKENNQQIIPVTNTKYENFKCKQIVTTHTDSNITDQMTEMTPIYQASAEPTANKGQNFFVTRNFTSQLI